MLGLLATDLADGGKRQPVTPPEPADRGKAGRPPPTPAPSSADDDLYGTGDICAPEPDRDDEQRDL